MKLSCFKWEIRGTFKTLKYSLVDKADRLEARNTGVPIPSPANHPDNKGGPCVIAPKVQINYTQTNADKDKDLSFNGSRTALITKLPNGK